MLYLLLAILSSALVSIVMRLSNSHIKNNMTMFMANYAVCVLLSWLFSLQGGAVSSAEGLPFAIGLGIASGIMYLGSFMLMQLNIQRNGVVLSATFMKLGVLVPTLMAVIFFHETPGIAVIIGFVLALVAMVIINRNPQAQTGNGSSQFLLLFILLAAGGFTDSLSNIYEKLGAAALKDLYLIFTFASACLLSLILKVYKKQQFTHADLGWGALIGIPNYFSARFLLYALSQVPATIAYPVYSIGALALVTITGVIAFHERLSRTKWCAMGLIVLALVLLNV